MRWFLDLDDTLIDTTKIYKQICLAVARAYNLNSVAFGVRLLRMRKKFPYGSAHGSLRLGHTLRSFGIDEQEAQNILHDELASLDFLYPDAHKLLNWLESSQIPPTILTFGDTQTQRFKLAIVPRLTSFKSVIVQTPKQDYLKTLPPQKSILVDDKIVADLPDWCTGVFLARKTAVPKEYKGRTIKSLEELLNESH